jgi:hypothetical protein
MPGPWVGEEIAERDPDVARFPGQPAQVDVAAVVACVQADGQELSGTGQRGEQLGLVQRRAWCAAQQALGAFGGPPVAQQRQQVTRAAGGGQIRQLRSDDGGGTGVKGVNTRP